MKSVEETVACICDYGTLGIALAERMAESCQKVYFHSPCQSEYQDICECSKGDGLPTVERLDEPLSPETIDEIDLYIFPDIGFTGLQRYLRSIGKAVWGSMDASELELYRTEFLTVIKELGLPVVGYKRVRGVSALSDYLKTVNKKWVKVNRYRAQRETFFHEDYAHSMAILDKLAVKFGGLKEQVVFVVQDDIPDAQEIGYDGLSVDGFYPNRSFQGYEAKNECYDQNTEVLTDGGWKFFRELDGSEKFFTLNIDDNRRYRMEYQSAIAHTANAYRGKMLAVETQNVSLLVTPNHRLLVQVDSQNQNAPLVTWGNNKGGTRTFHLGKKERKLVEARALNLEKGFRMPWVRGAEYRSTEKRHIRFRFGDVVMTKTDFAAFLGIYLSEGWTNGKRIVVAQQKYKTQMERVLLKCGLRFSQSNNKGCTNFEISNRPLARYLLQFGKSGDKYVPNWIKFSGVNIIKEFLFWYCMGDGSFYRSVKSTRGKKRERTTHRIATKSLRMGNDLQELYIKCGVATLVRRSPQSGLYIITAHSVRSKNYIFNHHANWMEYEGMVYCVTVPNGIIMIRRNGKPLWCGNSYLGSCRTWKELPEEVRAVNEALAPILRKHQYRNFVATEIRRLPDVFHFLDPTLRMPGQTGEQLLETCRNLPEVIWRGANGELIEPDYEVEFAAEATLHYKNWVEDEWYALRIPDKARRWFKGYHYCELDGLFHFMPHGCDEPGVMLGLGDSLEGAIDHLKKNLELLKDEPVSAKVEGFAELLKEIKAAEDEGVEFSDQPVPEPAIAVED